MDTTATPTSWTIDPAHANIEFGVRHLMISTVKGRFTGISGTIAAGERGFADARIDVTIDAKTIDTREPQRDAHLRSADFFDVEKFPTITFHSRRIDAHGADYRIAGDLTMHGVTREVVFDATEEGRGRDPWGNERAGFAARARLNRRDFGLTWNAALETGGVLVGDEVKISIDLELVAKALAA